MGHFAVLTKTRDFQGLWMSPGIIMTPIRMSHHMIGGPDRAEISVQGTESAVWDIIDWLRQPIEIYDDVGECCWWGYIHGIRVASGHYMFGVSLDRMTNRVAVIYNRLVDGATMGETTKSTWIQHDRSVAAYGVKASLMSLNDVSDAAALAYRDAQLQVFAEPQPQWDVNTGSDSVMGTLDCRGWWGTADWQYYDTTMTTAAPITDQIGAIVSASVPFLLSTSIRNTSSVLTSVFQEGNRTAQTILEKLLDVGTGTGYPLLAQVTPQRTLDIFQEPSRPGTGAPSMFLDRQQRVLSSWGEPIPNHRVFTGFWTRIKDVIPVSADVAQMGDPSLQFIEATEYDVATDRLTLTTRGQPSLAALNIIGRSL